MIDEATGVWQALGRRPVASRDGSRNWVVHEFGAYVCVPPAIGLPDDDARRELFWRRLAPLVSWVASAAPDGHDVNAMLYVCADPSYDLARLCRKTRRDVRHGLRAVTVRRVTFDELAQRGYPALQDTALRNRWAHLSLREFEDECRVRSRFSTEEAWAAFAGEELCAWVTTHRVGARVDLGCVSMVWRHRSLCATYALVYEVVRANLREKGATEVLYGLSSLQRESRVASLHRFKTWLGFTAVPVRRAFELHPLLRPLARRPIFEVAARALAVAPASRFTRKLQGVVDLMLGVPSAIAGFPVVTRRTSPAARSDPDPASDTSGSSSTPPATASRS